MTPSEPLVHGVSIRPTWTTKPSPSPDRNALTFSGKEAAGFRGRIALPRSNLPYPRLRIFTTGQTPPCAYLPSVVRIFTLSRVPPCARSEEHTSELQSRFD